jgi:predicted dehydrogenase
LKELTAAVVGVGFVGRAHLESLRRRGIPVRGILGSSPERTQQACRNLQVERAYLSLDELLQDHTVDVVHICTPNSLHFEQAKAVMGAGKHVVCEKPLSMNTGESTALIELARRLKRVGAVAYNLRYYPLCQEAHSLVRSGAIGCPRLVHGSFLQDWLLYPSDWNWRLEPQFSGPLRVVADIGTHWLDLLTWISGRKVEELCADLATIVPVRQKPQGRVETFQNRSGTVFDEVAIDTDDYASILLRLEDSVHGAVTVSQVSAGRKARLWFELDGSEGSLAWNSESPNTLWMGKRGEPNREMPKDPSQMSPAARGYAEYPAGHAEGYPDTFAQMFKDVYAYISKGDFAAPRTFPTFETGHEEMRLCEAISQSAKERRWVAVEARS